MTIYPKKGLRIRTKIALLATVLICAVVSGIVATIILVQQRQLRKDFSERIDAMMGGVERIAGEALSARDEIMLLSYLRHLMTEYPELELALVSREGHTSVLGAVRTELYYRNITAIKNEAAPEKSAGAGEYQRRAIPPGMLVIQLGLSKTALESQIRRAGFSMISKVLGIAGIGLLLGFLGSWLLSRRLAEPIVELAARIQSVAGGKQEEIDVTGDEIGYLKVQYENMASKITEFIRLKDELLMTLTHELNNPLVGLKALVDMLGNSAPRPSQKTADETYKIMSDAINAMELLLSNALEMFKMGNKPALKLREVSVNDIFSQVFSLFRPVAQSGGIEFREPVMPGNVLLLADEELLRRIIVNLVSNACKYTRPGGAVGLALRDSADSIEISVSDTGAGIAPEDLEHIFTRFYRAPGADGKARRIPGTGLGLAIAKQAAELHHGKIWVESEKGKGSVFYVSLPKPANNGELYDDKKYVFTA